MRGWFSQSISYRFLRAHAFKNAPALVQACGLAHYIVDLIASRERPPVQEHNSALVPLQKIACGFEHDVRTEVILPGRVLDFADRKKSVADHIFAEHTAGCSSCQLTRKRSLAGAGKARH